MIQEHQDAGQPWWKFGYVWLVIAGPATVVVAAFVTFYLAYSGVDPVIDEDYYRKGIEINKTLGEKQSGLTPALDARNHVATPDGPVVKQKP
jgi:hypothetical protein